MVPPHDTAINILFTVTILVENNLQQRSKTGRLRAGIRRARLSGIPVFNTCLHTSKPVAGFCPIVQRRRYHFFEKRAYCRAVAIIYFG